MGMLLSLPLVAIGLVLVAYAVRRPAIQPLAPDRSDSMSSS